MGATMPNAKLALFAALAVVTLVFLVAWIRSAGAAGPATASRTSSGSRSAS